MSSSFQELKDKILSDPKVKKYYDKLKPEFDKASDEILQKRQQKRLKKLLKEIIQKYPNSLESLHDVLVSFKESQET